MAILIIALIVLIIIVIDLNSKNEKLKKRIRELEKTISKQAENQILDVGATSGHPRTCNARPYRPATLKK